MPALTREKKEQIINNLAEKFNNTKVAVLTDYKGLKVEELEDLRERAKEKDVNYHIFKNTLVKLALKKAGLKVDESVFIGPLAIGFGDDEIATSKILYQFSKEHEALKIRQGILDKNLVEKDVIVNLALLPTREDLYSRLIRSLNAPTFGLVNVLGGNIRNLVCILNSYKSMRMTGE